MRSASLTANRLRSPSILTNISVDHVVIVVRIIVLAVVVGRVVVILVLLDLRLLRDIVGVGGG
jgi:hypothetical protein